jgi:tetratricopeptide (TPR) repeat protein
MDNKKFGELLDAANAALFTEDIQEEASALVVKISESVDPETVITELYAYSQSVASMTLTKLLQAMFTQEEMDEMIESYANSATSNLAENGATWIENINGAGAVTENRMGQMLKNTLKARGSFERIVDFHADLLQLGLLNFNLVTLAVVDEDQGKDVEEANWMIEATFSTANAESTEVLRESIISLHADLDSFELTYLKDDEVGNFNLDELDDDLEFISSAEPVDPYELARMANAFLDNGDLQMAQDLHFTIAGLQIHNWLFTLAFCSKRIGKWDDSLHLIQVAANAGSVDALVTLGFLAEEAGEYPEAQRWYQYAAQAGDAQANQNLAMCINDIIFSFCIPSGEWAVIDSLAQKAVAVDAPDQTTNALSNWGIAKYVQGDSETAKTLFFQALDRADKFAEAEASFYLSKIFEQQGDLKQAKQFRNRCISAGGYEPTYN